MGASISNNFAAIPYNNMVQGNIRETHLPAAGSSLKLRAEDSFDDNNITGYIEMDFVGNGAANLNVTTNSNTPRMRHAWMDWRKGDVEVFAGQGWSLLTPNRVGVSPENKDVYTTRNVDRNSQVGIVWTRADQIRLAIHSGNSFSACLALENPDQYVAAVEVIFPFQYNASLGTQFDAANQTGVPNLFPDVI